MLVGKSSGPASRVDKHDYIAVSNENWLLLIRLSENSDTKGFSRMHENNSEIARLRQLIADEYLAAQRGLAGLAYGAAKHTFITARLEQIGTYHEALKHLVGEGEATRMMADTLEEL